MTNLTNPAWQQIPTLTPHPLQQLGAYALAALAGVHQPGDLTPELFAAAVEDCTNDLVGVSHLGKAKDGDDGWWLACAYWLWPNSKATNNQRGKLTPEQRAQGIRAWRSPENPKQWPGFPCTLCSRPAVRVVGKPDVPVSAATTEINTWRHGTLGLTLCWGCLTSMWAAPYGAHIHGMTAISVHAEDPAFMAALVRRRVRATRQRIFARTRPRAVTGQYLQSQLAVQALRDSTNPRYRQVGAVLMVWNNHNETPRLDLHRIAADLAGWVRSTTTEADRRAAWPALCRAFHTPTVNGFASLAHCMVTHPDNLPARIAGALGRRIGNGPQAGVPDDTTDLHQLLASYLHEVMHMPDTHTARIHDLADMVARTIIARQQRQESPLPSFYNATHQPYKLKKWLTKAAFEHAIDPNTDGSYLGFDQFELLFSPETDHAHWYRDLLLVAVLDRLGRLGYRPSKEETTDATNATDEAQFDDEEDNQ